jgi:hypothetical protein
MELVRCLHCSKLYPPLDFEITRTIGEKVYRRRKCKTCKRKIQRQRTRRICAWLAEYKKQSHCKNCGLADFRVLTFHHRNPEDKTGHVGDLAGRGWSLQRVQAEIALCEVLCANCHLIEHHESRELSSGLLSESSSGLPLGLSSPEEMIK